MALSSRVSQVETVLRSSHAEWNGFHPCPGYRPFAPADAEGTIAARLLEAAQRHKSRCALVDWDGRELSYAGLLAQVLNIAGSVRRQLGEQQDGIVCLLFHVDVQGIRAILGALLAGFAYLPVDPSWPDDRLSRTIAAASPLAVLSCAAHVERLRALTKHRCFDIATLAQHTPLHTLPGGTPDQTVACFATSGTTGEPKLVALSHRAVLFDIGRQTNDLCLGPDDRFDLLFSLAFSASLAPLFGALLNGSELHPLDLREHPLRLFDWLERREITVSTMTTSTFRMAVSTARPAGGRCPRLRMLSLGGESVLGSDVEALGRVVRPSCVLQNAMASTEVRTYAQYFTTGASTFASGALPIGWPVWGKEISLLDPQGQAVHGAGEGEVAVISRYLASGYLNDPVLTAERFQIEPDGRTLFRTGDRARRSPDGCLTFLGRDDLQVKVRGHRVELSAIEAAIYTFPGVQECAVRAREETAGETQIIAFVSAKADANLSHSELLVYLQTRLPSYMRPAVLRLLNELPRSANGKIDRSTLNRLPISGQENRSLQSDDERLKQLASLWTTVLGHSQFTVDDSFFHCGGDSLKAFRLLMMMEESFGVMVPPDLLCSHSTLRDLSLLLDSESSWKTQRPRLILLQAAGARPPVFFLHPVTGSAEMYYGIVERLQVDRPCYAVHAAEFVAGNPRLTVESMAAAYLELIGSLLRSGIRAILAGHSFGGLLAYEMARQFEQKSGTQLPVVIIDIAPAVERRPRLQYAADVFMNLPDWLRGDSAMKQAGEAIRRRAKRLVARIAARLQLSAMVRRVIPSEPLSLLALAGSVLRNALSIYTPGPYAGPVILLRAEFQSLLATRDPTMGWGRYASDLRVVGIPGNHDSCLKASNIDRSVAILRRQVDVLE
jgi:amino acid adenylation domain-containing protein